MRRGKGKPIEVGEFAQYRDIAMTADLAKILWDYDPISGTFRWKGSPRTGISCGDEAGVIGFQGYRVLCFYGKKYRAARIAFLFMTGSFPVALAEHKNTNRADDRWDNLRDATQSQNLCNHNGQSRNKLGIKGVVQSREGKFHAYICFAGKRKNLGTFPTAELAKAAYDAAAKEWHGEFARVA